MRTMKKLLAVTMMALALSAVAKPANAMDKQEAGGVVFGAGIIGALLAPTPIGAAYWFAAGIAGAIYVYRK